MPDYLNSFAPSGSPLGSRTSSPGMQPGGAPIAQPEVPPTTGIPEADAPPEIQEKVITLGAKAKSKIYGDPENFQNMMAMLEQAGPRGFPQAASTIVNTVLDELENEEGRQSEEVLAAAGAIVLGAISEDLSVGGAMEVTPEMFQKAAAKAMQDWMSNHPERVDQQAVMSRLAGGQAPQQPPMEGTPQPAPPQQPPSQPATTTMVPEGGGYLGGRMS